MKKSTLTNDAMTALKTTWHDLCMALLAIVVLIGVVACLRERSVKALDATRQTHLSDVVR